MDRKQRRLRRMEAFIPVGLNIGLVFICFIIFESIVEDHLLFLFPAITMFIVFLFLLEVFNWEKKY